MCVAVHCHHYTPPLELSSFKNWTLPNWATASYPLLWLQQPISSFDFVSKWSVPQRSAHVTSVVQSETGKGRLKSFTNSSCSGRRAFAPMLSSYQLLAIMLSQLVRFCNLNGIELRAGRPASHSIVKYFRLRHKTVCISLVKALGAALRCTLCYISASQTGRIFFCWCCRSVSGYLQSKCSLFLKTWVSCI